MPRRDARSLLDVLISRLNGKRPSRTSIAPHRPFQAIAIYRGVEACDSAKRFADHRFLARDAPQLPLPGCSFGARCECSYLKYKDRRGESRRMVDFGASHRLFSGEDRRRRKGRRAND